MNEDFWLASVEVAVGIALFYAAVMAVGIVFHLVMAVYFTLEERRQFRKEIQS